MITLAIVFGSVGAVLVLVGMVGGNFEFSGAVIPKVGTVARVLSTATGAVFVIAALLVVALDPSVVPPSSQPQAAPSPSTSTAPGTSPSPPPAPASVPPTVTAPVQAGGAGGFAFLFEGTSTSAPIAAELPHGYVVEIVCTMQGDAVTSELTGVTSSLWNGVSAGGVLGFLPDVYVETGTYDAVMPSCDSPVA